jgi:cytochrome c oxidase subunit 1
VSTAPRPAAPAPPEPDLAALERAWRQPRGLLGWLSNIDHKEIGKRYIVTALGFFALAGIEALLMRIQLARPENNLLNPDLYNQIFSMHGTTMMFLFAVPVMEGLGIYFVPLMVGTRNVPFPKLNALGYWMYLAGGLFLYGAFLRNGGPEAGWFSYVPLSGPQYSSGHRVDVWAQMITFTEVSALIVATQIVVCVFKQRAPGMSLHRIPLFCWALVVTSLMIIFAMPAVMFASGALMADRTVGTHFFNPGEGGDALLWQHLFWFFGHPEVYLIFIPGLGMMSVIISAATRRPIFGYTAMVLSLITTSFMGFGLWVHHMFATGLPQVGESFFTSASMIIALPTGVQIFCWLATIWGSRPRWDPPFLFAIGFFVTFLIGGFTGLMLGSVPLDLQVHDTMFVVAHLHYVLIGGAVFPLLGALHHWFPKWTGRMPDRRLGIWTFALFLVGFHMTFFPLHVLGLRGMPRRVYTYPTGFGWHGLNVLATCGAGLLGTAVLLMVVNAIRSARAGARAPMNPWNAETLEWAVASPPPPYDFASIPIVGSRSPLWEGGLGRVTGMQDDCPEVLVTHAVDAEPSHREELPKASIWPFVVAITITIGFIGSVFSPIWIPIGALLSIPGAIGWYWPTHWEPPSIEAANRP